MANPYIGQVSPFAFPFAPVSWAFCDGATVPMNQYSTLFSLIGTVFGGNGSTTIGLPNLVSVSPCGTGQGPGLTQRSLGQPFGTISVTLDQTTMATHNHAFTAVPLGRGQAPNPTPSSQTGLASSAPTVNSYASGSPNAAMSANAVVANGGGGAHNNMQPYVTMNYCIALLGTYPYFP